MEDYKQKCEELEFLIKNLYPTMSDYQKEKVEEIIPELRESEDERIAEELIIYLPYCDDIAKDTKERWIAWLEKQKERSGLTKDEEFTLNRIIEHFEEEGGYDKWIEVLQDIRNIPYQKPIEEVDGDKYGIDGLWHAERILEKTLGDVEGYQSDDGLLEHNAAITAVKKLKGIKRAEWSEEDEYEFNTILGYLVLKAELYKKENNNVEYERWTAHYYWLKLLKSRLKPQPKQEWNEEDEKY